MLCICMFTVSPAVAQVTTGTVSGTVKDAQGAVVPGATVVLISEAQQTRSLPAATSTLGDYVMPNLTPDVYTVQVTMKGFRTAERRGVLVSPGGRVSLTAVMLQPGGPTDAVDVVANQPVLQAEGGERSFVVSGTQIESLPINHGNFAQVASLVPGVLSGGVQAAAGATRLGGSNQNNVTVDGISMMDTGSNSVMFNLNIESIAAVKVEVAGYQSEFGRSSGLQIGAVTKAGSNAFHASFYRIDTNSKWDAKSWAAEKNGDPKARYASTIGGFSVSGPVGRPGRTNKLFFFYAHEYRPSTTATNGGNPIRLRVPTDLERRGDFSQTLDQTGTPFPYIKDPASSAACSPAVKTGCFQADGVLGRIPTASIYQPGLALLSRYPRANVTQVTGTNYNYEVPASTIQNLTRQPVLRVDYQWKPTLRITGRYAGQRSRRITTPGSIPGFNDVTNPYPFITTTGISATWVLTPTTVLDATYGMSRNQLASGGSGGIVVNASANSLDPANGLSELPLLFPKAGQLPTASYAAKVLRDLAPAWWDGIGMNLPPVFAWGPRAGAAVPNQQFPRTLGINRTQDWAVNLTKVAGEHTLKVGAYNNHSYNAQNVGSGGVANLSFQGFINFGEGGANTLDSGFGYANAALGVFQQYLQQEKYVEGSLVYNNLEFFGQDTWKIGRRLTIDAGLRVVHQQPQQDQFAQTANFFSQLWSPSFAPILYVPGCLGGAVTCVGDARNAKNPISGNILTAPGVSNTQTAIGTPVADSGDLTNGILRAGDSIEKSAYLWPRFVYAPRAGVAYDLTGRQTMILRGAFGYYYDRPDGNTVLATPGYPAVTSQDLRNGQLSALGQGLSVVPLPSLTVFQYQADVPTSVQWNAGLQMSLPWSSSLDLAYVGDHGYNRLGGFQGSAPINLNAVDFGTAYKAAYQDTTLPATTVPGANAFSQNLLRSYAGYAAINQNATVFHETYQGVQASWSRRFMGRWQAGVNYTLGLQLVGNTGLQKRLQHGLDGNVTIRSDQVAYEELNRNLDNRRHVIKANWVWDLPNVRGERGPLRALGYVVNDWLLAGILTAGSQPHYDLFYQYQSNGTTTSLTGSPDYIARIVYTGDPGSGCSDNQFAQFNTAVVKGPTYNSLGLESGRNVLSGCPDRTVDLAISRTIRLGGGRQVQLRLDAFNAFNVAVINARNVIVLLSSPTAQLVGNSETLPDGTLNPARLTPRTAGFGAATGAQSMRSLQLTARFSF
jgi:Carboxypeptidase regulatory-like domain